MKIVPVNGHLVIEPVEHKEFVETETSTYQEIGVVRAISDKMEMMAEPPVSIGDKVYFDSWLAAKYPGNERGTFVWLVNWENVRAIQHAEPSLPE